MTIDSLMHIERAQLLNLQTYGTETVINCEILLYNEILWTYGYQCLRSVRDRCCTLVYR